MENKDADENEGLIVPSEYEGEAAVKEECQSTPTQTQPVAYPFKKWMESFRTRKRLPPTIAERYVEGWSDSSQTESSAQDPTTRRGSIQDQRWDRLSGHSSQLGTVKTTEFSITSQSVARSRGATQSTTTQSIFSDQRISAESSRPRSSGYVDEAAEQRANKRRQVLRELVATEADYVQGLKALTGVSLVVCRFARDILISDF